MKAKIDTLLGRVPMYRLVTLCLIALTVVAFAASALGGITYRPGALLASLATLVVVTVASGRLFAILFRSTSHSESSFITALLLFFILLPSTDLTALAQAALAALFASASKYVIAFRGRHLLNPAAVGALWLTLFQLYVALWWVGTPMLLPATAVLTLLVAYRTHRVPMATIFVVIAGVILLGRGLSNGTDLGAALKFGFAQTPLIFFAGFMLTEPLTLPPLRWQQIVVATVVAVLFSVPITIGFFPVGPEAALIVGNLVAFGFVRRSGIELVLTEKNRLSESAVEFTFRPVRPFAFRPGQYLELDLPHRRPDSRGTRRSFSIASAPTQESVKIGLKMPTRKSSFKSALDLVPVGGRIRATGVSGNFLLPRDRKTPVLLIAGGIGITPFISQLGALPASDRPDIVLLFAPGDDGELPYRQELTSVNVRTVLVGGTSITDLPLNFETMPGRLTTENLASAVPDVNRRHVYVSGSPAFVNSVARSARAAKAKRITKDYFSGY